MDRRLSPLAVAITSSLMLNANAWANAGANGANGSIIINAGEFSSGASGINSSYATNGEDGAPLISFSIVTLDQSNGSSTAGSNGGNSTDRSSAGGIGGAGGGSVFGGFSQGGAGSSLGSQTNNWTTNGSVGGAGGAISNKTINRGSASTLVLTGAAGGLGGNAGSATYYTGDGAGGAGGSGGGTVFGGFSQGGGGGITLTSGAGGAGGAIASINIDLSNLTLDGGLGAAGGRGGYNVYTGSTGAGGAGGIGGGSVFGGVSQGGAGGRQGGADIGSADGGFGGAITDIYINLSDIVLNGQRGGDGGRAAQSEVTNNETVGTHGAGGNGGSGGGSIFSAFSQGGAAGLAASASGGAGGSLSGLTITLKNAILNGAQGGDAGQASSSSAVRLSFARGAGGIGGAGGGSVFGGVTQGGGSGNAQHTLDATGGAGGAITLVSLDVSGIVLNGSVGGSGGDAGQSNSRDDRDYTDGAGGAGGVGGGSVFGGLSQGGGGGYSANGVSDGGGGGEITNITIRLQDATLIGQNGGSGGQAAQGLGLNNSTGAGAGGAGGAGGGSIFAGFSQGGAGGGSTTSARGGGGGDVHSNTLNLSDVRLTGAVGGDGGAGGRGVTRSFGADGSAGIDGGSIFGGYSAGGAGGYVFSANTAAQINVDGGNGGSSSNNRVEFAGTSSITGSLYGGYSQGGTAGQVGLGGVASSPTTLTSGSTGVGGLAENNHITLVGTNLTIGGSVYGGYSLDGDNTVQNSRAFTGNTLALDGYRGSVEGVYNFEHYNWILPADVVNRDVLIEIRGNDLVDLNNTTHTVAMLSDGNRLNVNDEVVLISKAQGAHRPTRTAIQQGHFIIYDALLDINNSDEFVLTIAGKDDGTSVPPSGNTPPPTPTPDKEPIPAGRLNPTAKAFLEGRAAALALVNHGADMISEQLTECATDLFMIGDGGSSRYNTGSSVKVSDQRLAIGGRKCFELPDTSQLMLGVFAEHGTGNYHSRNHFAGVGNVRGHGDLRYTGGGLVAHMDYAGTGADISPAPVLASKDGLYVDAVLRAGHVKSDFASNQLIDAAGKRAEYTSKSHYASAMLGAGYAWNLDEQQQVDLYARYTWDRLGSDKVKVGGDELRFGNDHSARLRVGTRYNYAVTPAIAPYAGIAYEHEFDGKVSGKVFTFDIDQPELKGSSGMLEVGVRTLPFGDDSGWHLDAGVQGYFGTRKGVTGSLSVKYEF